MWDKFRIYKKLGIEKKYIQISVVTVLTGLFLFIGYELIRHSGVFFTAVGAFIGKFFGIIRPMIVGFIVAYLLYPVVMAIEKGLRKIIKKRGSDGIPSKMLKDWVYRIISILIVFILLVLLLIGIANFVIPPLLESGKALIDNIPQYEKVVTSGVDTLNKLFDSMNIDPEKVNNIMGKISSIFTMAGEKLVTGITTSIQGIGSFLVDFVLSIIFSFYFLKDKEMLFRVIKKYGGVLIPKKVKPSLKQMLIDLDEVVGKFIKGVILDAIIVAIVSSILLLIIHHPFAILVGILAGICNIVPYIGPLVGELIAFVLGLFSSITTGIWGFIVLLLYQQLDGNIIQPKIVGGKVGLAPVFTLMALTIGGGYGGIVGMLVAVPIAGMVSIYVKRFYKRKYENQEPKRDLKDKSSVEKEHSML